MNREDLKYDLEVAEQAHEEQKYVCSELKTAIQCIEKYCEYSNEKAYITQELTNHLEGATSILVAKENALSAAERRRKSIERQQPYKAEYHNV